MSAMYTDAKDWFKDNAEIMSREDLISCILCNLDNDDIERWFGVSMERNEDNPGAESAECPVCGNEVDELVTVNGKWDMCEDCQDRFEDGELALCPECESWVDNDDDLEAIENCGMCASCAQDNDKEWRKRCAICAGSMDEDDTDQICADCGIDVLDELTVAYGWWYSQLTVTGQPEPLDVWIWEFDYPCDGVHAVDTNIYSRE